MAGARTPDTKESPQIQRGKTKLTQFVSKKTTALFDSFFYFRQKLAELLVWSSLRVIGSEVTLAEVKRQSLDTVDGTHFDVQRVGDVETILETAKACFDAAESRRVAITDKCKTLLTLGSLFLGIVGFLLPKELAYDNSWIRALLFVTVLLFLHAVALLLLFFVTGKGMEVCISQEELHLEPEDLKLSLVKSYLQCRADTDQRSSYLVEVYKAARFSFFGAFVCASFLFTFGFLSKSQEDPSQQLIRSIRGNPKLIETLRGPKGDTGFGKQGPPGKPGVSPKVDIDEIAETVFKKARNEKLIPPFRPQGDKLPK